MEIRKLTISMNLRVTVPSDKDLLLALDSTIDNAAVALGAHLNRILEERLTAESGPIVYESLDIEFPGFSGGYSGPSARPADGAIPQ